VPFAVTVEAGRQYKLGAIHLPPDAPVQPADIDKVLSSTVPGQARGTGLRSVWLLVAQRYKSKGHLDCALTPHAQIDEAAGVSATPSTFDPGPVYHLACQVRQRKRRPAQAPSA